VKDLSARQVETDSALKCLAPGVPRIGPPHKIVQNAKEVVFLYDDVNGGFFRIIPVDGRTTFRKDLPASFLGDSIGRFEADTLVVETTNFNGKNAFRNGSENMKVTERFTRVSDNEITYRFTVEDPATWDRPWTAEMPMAKTIGPIFEFACHESNHGVENILAGARAEEKRAAEGAAKKGSN